MSFVFLLWVKKLFLVALVAEEEEKEEEEEVDKDDNARAEERF